MADDNNRSTNHPTMFQRSVPQISIVPPAPTTPAHGVAEFTPPDTPASATFPRPSDWPCATLLPPFASQTLPQAQAYVEDDRVLGGGAWSSVHRGRLKESGGVVAIKKALNKEARKVLLGEARVLAYISRSSPRGIAGFYGVEPDGSRIILEYIEGVTLAEYSKMRGIARAEAMGTVSRAQRSAPVIGLKEWLSLAAKLADAFVHLKNTKVVHGDVTWNNVLLRNDGSHPYPSPVLIDFSSSHIEGQDSRPAPISAVTTGFCSPELLQAFIRRPMSPPPSPTSHDREDDMPYPIPTYASDMYGLAMTLLSSALGQEVYESAGRHVGIYARQGYPLDWARSSGEGMFIAAHRGTVAKLLNGCYGKTAEKRIGIEEFRDRVGEATRESC